MNRKPVKEMAISCVLFFVSACGAAKDVSTPAASVPPTQSPRISTEKGDLGRPPNLDCPCETGACSMECAQLFDEQKAMAHVEFLAGDDFKGRLVGTEENMAASQYIADRFEEYGLEPAGENGGYYQPFTSQVSLNTVQPVLEIVDPCDSTDGPACHTYTTHYDYSPRIVGSLGSGDVTGRVVWLGGCAPADFDDADRTETLADAVVLCAPLTGSEQITPYDQTGAAVEKALHDNVGGLLIIRPDDGPYSRSGYGFGDLIDMPAFGVSLAVAEDLLAGSPYTLEDLGFDLQGVYHPDQMSAPVPAALAATVHMASQFERTTADAHNVLGLLPGSDPVLKNQLIIIGAHYDHVGTDPDGTIYPGANDNASGVAVMLEIARLWKSLNYHPRQSVLFTAWDAEEQGLYGSRHYVDNPLPGFPLDQTLGYLNLDMAGRGDILYIYGQDNPIADQLQRSAEALGLEAQIVAQYLADDLPFHEAGIPSVFPLMETESPYDLYLHRPEDRPENIQLSSLRTIGVLAAHTLFSWLGGSTENAMEPVTIKLVQREGEERIPAGTPIQLNANWVADTEAHMADFLAAAALYITLNGQPLPDVDDYWGPVEPYQGGAYISQWLYPLGVLSPGTYTLEIRCTLSQPVTDGFDTNQDGQADIFSGEIWHFSMEIVVY